MTDLQSRIFWLASYPRSGNTWLRMYLYNLVKMLGGADTEQDINLLHCFSPSDADRIHYGKYLDWSLQTSLKHVAPVRRMVQQAIATEANEYAEESNGLVFVKTNWLLGDVFGHHSIDFALSAGAIYLIRNPLDVAVSLAHHMDQPIDFAIDFMCAPDASYGGDAAVVMIGSWSQNAASWTRHPRPDISVIRYEDLLSDPILWFTVLTRQIFPKASPAADLIQRAIERCSFEHLRAQEQSQGWYFGKSREAEQFFREGRAGQWQQALTRQQADRIVNAHGELMRQFGYLPAG
jgi:hypothetical protein